MDRYRWNLLGLCELRWKNFGKTTTEEGHKLYYSGEENKHEYDVGFLVHKDTMKSVMGCRPISSRLISIRLRADPFNITIIQVYSPTTDYSDDQIEDFYSQLQRIIDQAPKKDILIVQGDWNAKVSKDTQENWQNICGPICNATTNESCYLQQIRSGQYIRSSQSIQEEDVALSEWPASQPYRLHFAETAILVRHKYCKDSELFMRRHRK